MSETSSKKPLKTQIVVVGGGAAGLELARRLGSRYGDGHDIILVDRDRTHVWKPLLHEVAAGSLDPNLDEVGYGGHAARWGYRYYNGTLEKIDRERQVIVTEPLVDERGDVIVDRHEIRYDYLVLAIGGVSNDFGIEGVREHAMFLEHRRQADEFRRRLLNACLRVNDKREHGDRDAQLRICIVGGGATGVELSAELYNCARGLRTYGLETFEAGALRVTLLEAGPKILPMLRDDISEAAVSEMEALGIDVRTGAMVNKVEPGRVHIKDDETIEADMILWATGVRGDHDVSDMTDLELDRINRFKVRPTLQTTMDDRIFAIGDCAHCQLEGRDGPVPPRAQAANQMAKHCFQNLVRLQEGKPLKDFVYKDHGALISLSNFDTVGSLMGNLMGGSMAVQGRIARFAYHSLYRMHLMAVHGWLRGLGMIVVGHVNKVARPKLKLH